MEKNVEIWVQCLVPKKNEALEESLRQRLDALTQSSKLLDLEEITRQMEQLQKKVASEQIVDELKTEIQDLKAAIDQISGIYDSTTKTEYERFPLTQQKRDNIYEQPIPVPNGSPKPFVLHKPKSNSLNQKVAQEEIKRETRHPRDPLPALPNQKRGSFYVGGSRKKRKVRTRTKKVKKVNNKSNKRGGSKKSKKNKNKNIKKINN